MPTPAPTERTRMPAAEGYGFVSRLNHWLTAAAFLAALGTGLVIDHAGLADEQVFALYDWHMLFGTFVLLYGLWRVGWRVAKGFPISGAPMPRWQEIASRAVHLGLLGTIAIMPISGVLMTVSGGFDVAVWGVVLVPSIGEVEGLNAAAGAVHWILSFVILGLLALHIGAALKHHLVDRDPTLDRMTTGRSTSAPR